MLQKIIQWAEQGWLPDQIIRMGMRQLVQQRYAQQEKLYQNQNREQTMLDVLSQGPIAENTQEANEQHYEVPAQFYAWVLGPALKYSSAYFSQPDDSLYLAEQAMLQKYGEFAQLEDGMDILELGCGWGSLTLWMAQQYPNSTIEAISNSRSQHDHIMQQCVKRDLHNVKVRTVDINEFTPHQTYDRVVSVEMFEHLRNYHQLFEQISSWLNKDGKLFVHIFCHRRWAYLFETEGADNWMGKYFFTGGVMPNQTTFENIQSALTLEEKEWVSGQHYQQTAAAWRQNLKNHADDIEALFGTNYGPKEARRWLGRWNMFFMACEELFGYRKGQEWGVSLYRFSKASKT